MGAIAILHHYHGPNSISTLHPFLPFLYALLLTFFLLIFAYIYTHTLTHLTISFPINLHFFNPIKYIKKKKVKN